MEAAWDNPQAVPTKKAPYQAAVYLRLSRDDTDIGKNGKAESDSIRSQRELIDSFIRGQEGMEAAGIYTDDGYSGACFARPAFLRMMEDIRSQKVNCVIVKDLSRFGRDYIEAGRLLQRVFPALGVRFIAVTDHYDSLTASDRETSFLLPVKNFINDSYCQDISVKIKSQKRIRQKRGEFVGAFSVYGYQKGTGQGRLVVDGYAAMVVQKIFFWRMCGMSCQRIAKKLEERGILSPYVYKKTMGVRLESGFATRQWPQWSAVAVRRILQDETYTGTLVQGKTQKISHKEEKRYIVPKECRICRANTHEAVITKEEFENVQRLSAADCRASGGGKFFHPYAGLLFCGDCKRPLVPRRDTAKKRGADGYVCPTFHRGKGCSKHFISQKELGEILGDAIRLQAAVWTEGKGRRAKERDLGEVFWFGEEIRRLGQVKGRLHGLLVGLGEDLEKGILGQEDFADFSCLYGEYYRRLQEAVKKQEGAVRRFWEEGGEEQSGRMAVAAFVERIEVYEDKRIGIRFRFRDGYKPDR